MDDTPSTVNVSAPINLDWVVWGADGQTTAVTRKASANLIGDPLAGATTNSFWAGCRSAFNWTGGAPIASGMGVVGCVGLTGSNGGIVLTAPASTAVQTLKLFVQDWQNPKFVAYLSDGSAPAIVDTSVSGPSYVGEEKTYSFDYRAASSGQQLTVVITGNVYLEAAVLQPHLPEVSLLSPSDGQSLAAPSNVPVGLNALQFDNGIAATATKANQNQVFSSNTAPYSGVWQASAGHYWVRATATDGAGLSSGSMPEEVDIIGGGGALSGTVTELSKSTSLLTDLTSDGTADWIIFAPSSAWSGNNSSQSYTGVIRKNGVTPLISTARKYGQGSFYNSQGFVGEFFQFEDGTTDPSDSYISFYAGAGGASSGYEITVAADTTQRTLRLHTAVANGTARLKAFLSDGSAPVLIDRSLTPSSGMYSVGGVYSLTYQAASAGQTLTVRLTVDGIPSASDEWKEVDIYAAMLDGSAIDSAPQVTSLAPTSGSSGTIVSIMGSAFGATGGGSSYVSFGNVQAPIIGWSESEVDVEVPDGACGGPVVVTANGLSSNTVAFTIPAQIAITPSSAGLIVGQNLQLNAINAGCGTSLSGATWSLTRLAQASAAFPLMLNRC